MKLTAINVLEPGTHYSPATTVVLTGGDGTATVVPVLSPPGPRGSKIVSVEITETDGEWTSAPAVSFVDATGSGAVAEAVVE